MSIELIGILVGVVAAVSCVMYPWLMAAGAAMAAAGAGTQIAASESARAAMEKETEEQLRRSRAYDVEQEKVFKRSLIGSTPEVSQQQLAAGQRRYETAYKDLAQRQLADYGSVPLEMPRTVQVPTQMRMDMSNLSRARNQAYTQWDLDQMIKNLRAAQELQNVGMYARDSASVLPYELQTASRSADDLMMAGSLLGTTGGLLGTYGALQRPKVKSNPLAGANTSSLITG